MFDAALLNTLEEAWKKTKAESVIAMENELAAESAFRTELKKQQTQFDQYSIDQGAFGSSGNQITPALSEVRKYKSKVSPDTLMQEAIRKVVDNIPNGDWVSSISVAEFSGYGDRVRDVRLQLDLLEASGTIEKRRNEDGSTIQTPRPQYRRNWIIFPILSSSYVVFHPVGVVA